MFWGFTEKPDFRGGFSKNQYKGGIACRGWLWQFTGLREAWKKRKGSVFEGGWWEGWYTSAHFESVRGLGKGKGKRMKKKRYLPLLLNIMCDKWQGM